MNRLTEWRNGHGAIVNNRENFIDKLTRYEDMEEKGELIIFPCCNIGDTIFYIYKNSIYRTQVYRIVYEKTIRGIHDYIYLEDTSGYTTFGVHFENFGKIAFINYEEAKKALEKRMNEHESK